MPKAQPLDTWLGQNKESNKYFIKVNLRPQKSNVDNNDPFQSAIYCKVIGEQVTNISQLCDPKS